jgi:hypothetical protein
MEGTFCWRTFREQDRLRFSSADVHRDRQRRPKCYSRPAAPTRFDLLPRNCGFPPECEFSETLYIQDQCDLLYTELCQLRAELVGLRQRRAELQTSLTEHHNQQVIHDADFESRDPGKLWSAVEHKSAQDILRARKERVLTKKDKVELNDVIELSNIESRGEVVTRQRLVTRERRAEIVRTAEEIDDFQFRVRQLRCSAIYEDVQHQRLRIEELEARLESLLQENRRLKADYAFAGSRHHPETAEEIDKSLEIKSLLKKLAKVTQRKKELSRDAVRAQNEYEEAVIFERMHTERIISKLRTVFIGFFDDTMTEADLHGLMDRFGNFACVVTKRDYQDSERSCAFLEYQTHEEAADAVLIADGSLLKGFMLKVLWSDERPDQPHRPQAPAPQDRSTAPRPRRSFSRPASAKKDSARSSTEIKVRAKPLEERTNETGNGPFFATNCITDQVSPSAISTLLVEEVDPSDISSMSIDAVQLDIEDGK